MIIFIDFLLIIPTSVFVGILSASATAICIILDFLNPCSCFIVKLSRVSLYLFINLKDHVLITTAARKPRPGCSCIAGSSGNLHMLKCLSAEDLTFTLLLSDTQSRHHCCRFSLLLLLKCQIFVILSHYRS